MKTTFTLALEHDVDVPSCRKEPRVYQGKKVATKMIAPILLILQMRKIVIKVALVQNLTKEIRLGALGGALAIQVDIPHMEAA